MEEGGREFKNGGGCGKETLAAKTVFQLLSFMGLRFTFKSLLGIGTQDRF